MPGEKKQFIVQIPGEEHVAYWDEAKFNANQDKLYGKYPDAQVTEVNTQSINTPEDVDENGMYAIAVPGEEHVAQWDGKRLAKNREALLKKYPGAQVARINRYDYGAGIDNRSYRVQAQIDEVDRDISRGQKSNGLTEKRAALEQQLADLKGMGDAYQTALRDKFDEAVKSGDVQYSSPQWAGLQNGETEEQHRKRTEDELAALQSNAPAQHDWAQEAAALNLTGEAFIDEMARRRKQAADEQKEYEERLLKAQFEHDSNPLVQLDKRIDDGKADVQRLGDILRAKRDSYQAPAYVPPGAIMNTRDAALMSDKDYVRTQVAYTNALDRLHKDEMIRDHTVNSFWANAGNAVANPESWTFGLGKLYETGVVMDAVKDQGSESAKEALEQTFLSQMTDAEYQEKQGNKGRWGQMTGEMAQFVILNALGGSLFGGLGEAAKKKIVGDGSASLARRFLGAVASDAIVAALTENTAGAANTIAEILQKHNGYLSQNEDGTYSFEDGDNWWKSIWNTETEQFTEYFTERVGEHFGTIGGKIAGSKIGRALGLKKVADFIKREPVSGFEAGVKNFYRLAGVQGYPSEVMEEEIGIVMSNMLQWKNPIENIKGAWEGITDKEQQADIFGGMAFSIGLMQSVPLGAHLGVQGYNKIHGARLNDNLNRADQNAHRTFDSEVVWNALKDRIDAAANEDMTPLIYEIANNDSLKEEEKRAALNYVDGTLRLRGFSTGVMSELQQATMTRRDAEAKDLLNTYGKFWTEDEVDFGADRKRAEGLEGTSLVMTDEDGKAKTEKGSTRKIQYARRLTFTDDAGTGFTEGFVLSEDEGKVLVKANDGKAYFVDKEALAQMSQDGKATDSGRVPLFMVLDQRATDMKDVREQQRMQQEARENAGNLMNVATPGTQINIGTEGAENVATVQGYENGQFVVVDSNGQQQTMSPKEMAGHLGMPFDPKTDEQINEINGRADEKTRLFRNYQGKVFNYNGQKYVLNDVSFKPDQNGNLQATVSVDGGEAITMTEQEADEILSSIDGDKANEYNDKIRPGSTIHVSMEGMEADYVFKQAVVEDGDIIIKATDAETGEDVDLTPEMVTNLDELMNGTEISRDVNGNPVPETPAVTTEGTQPTDFFDDPVANALGISQDYVHVTPSGSRVLNRAKLWEDNPELWARWYDQQPDKTMSTRDYLENKLKKADEDVAAAVNEYAVEDQGEQNPDRLEELRAKMNDKMARQQQIKSLFDKYDAAQQAAAREAENAQREQQAAEAQQEAAPQSIVGEEQAAPATAEEILAGTQAALDSVDQQMAQVRSAEDYRLAMEAKAEALQQMFDALGAENTVVSTRADIVEVFRAAGGSEANARALAENLRQTAGKERLRGFYNNGKIFIIADDIRGAEDANVAQLHEAKHMENAATGAVNEGLRTGVTEDEMRAAIFKRTGSHFYDDKSRRELVDEVLANAEEIAEREGVEAIPQRLAEAGIVNGEFINFVQKNINNGRRGSQRRHLGGRHALQSVDSEVSGREDVRDTQPQPAAVEGQGLRPDAGGEQGAGGTAEQPAEPAGEPGLAEEPAPQSAEEAGITREITANIGGRIEEEGGEAPTLFSITAGAEGVGLNATEADESGNVVFMSKDGRIFDGHNPITAEDLKNEPNTVMGFMMADALKYGTITPEQTDTIWQKYADILNRMLEKGLAENGGFDNLSSQWQWVGETVFKTIHDNSDAQYKHSIDITRVCKKNEAVIKAISAHQRRLGYGITPGQIMDIYRSSIEEGYQVPCPVCYVFSRYIGNGYIATVAINGQKKYGSRLVDPSTMTDEEKKEAIKYWVKELQKVEAKNEKHKDKISQAKKDIQTILNEIDGLSRKALDKATPKGEKAQALRQIKALDKRYKAALNVVSQSNLAKWIKNFAIKEVKGGWTLYDDTFQGFPAEYALDLRLTADAIRKYPGIQRMRKSLGSAGGKVIQFAANNDIGDVPMLLGHSESEKAKNYYKLAAEAKTDAERNALLQKATDQFGKALIYAQQQSLRGGQRMWSWSDNIERLAPDVFFNLMQMEMLGGALQSYSKQLEGINMVANMGGYVNGSLMGKGIGYQDVAEDQVEMVDGREVLKEDITETVTEYDGDGAKERTRILAQAGSPIFSDNGRRVVLVFDDIVGVDPYGKNGKKGLFALNATLDKAGNILVGMDDTHIRAAMADDRVFFIIPWHKSGLSSHILAQMMEYLGVDTSEFDPKDYTNVQEEKDPADGNVTPELVSFWEAHKNETDFPVGFGRSIPSGRDGKLSQEQIDYRNLRDAIFDGRVDENPKFLKAVMRDAFLSQVYEKVKERVAAGKMTAGDKKYVYPYEYWDESSTYATADVNGARYLEYCRRLGIKPKFVGKLDANAKEDFGNFADDKGYWKLLIDRRMYDVDGNFQDLTPVTTDNFTPDLVDPEMTEQEFEVTKVADDTGVERIADRTMALEENRPGGMATVDYDMDLDRAVRDYDRLSLSVVGGEENQLTDAQRFAYEFVNGTPVEENASETSSSEWDNLRLSISEETQKLFDAAKERFGTTRDIREAGYVLPDGTMLDFSGRHWLAPGSDSSYLAGDRQVDHRDIADLEYERDGNTPTGIDTSMSDFIRRGAIRINDGSGASINLAVKPTPEQASVLTRLIEHNNGDVYLDLGDGDRTDASTFYEGAKARRVINDIKRYFDEGIAPEGGINFSIRGILGAAEDETAMANLDTAKQMEADGKDAKTIWLATGWEKGADGKWRNEIPDATPKPFGLSKRSLKVEDIVDAPELFTSYPEMKDYKVSLKKMSGAGAFNPKEKEIEMDRDYNTTIAVRDEDQEAAKEYFRQRWAEDPTHPADIRKDTEKKYGVRVLDATGLRTVMHELQHAIQDIEGFARGGNNLGQARDYIAAATKERPELGTFTRTFSSRNSDARLIRFGRKGMAGYLDRLVGTFDTDEKNKSAESLRDYISGLDDWGYRNFVNEAGRIWRTSRKEGEKSYNNLAGEVEARNVETRMGLTEEQRKETPISATEDVAREEQGIRFSVVTDPAEIERLESGEKEVGFRTVNLNSDGSFGSPKAGRLRKKGEKSVKTSSFHLQEWEKADENPDLATEDGKIDLADIGGVDYNPYIHIRPDAINKQFTSAWRHPEQVYIQTSYPTSELSSGYHAEKAKLPVGRHAWTNGDLILSRWDKPERIVPWEEVADAWEQEFKDTGVTFDIVSPNLLPILAERGVEILPPKKAAGKPAMDAYERWKKEQESPRFSITAEQDQEYLDAVNAGDMEKAQRMVEEAAKAAMPETVVVDGNYTPRVVLHGTNAEFNVFDERKSGSATDPGWLGRGFYFYGNNPEYASQYGRRIVRAFLNIENPYFADYEDIKRLSKENSAEASEEFRQSLIDEGYDGVNYNGDLNDEWVAFYPSQIKSADPVTYDNEGNVIPLSERFNPENDDIRFSVANENQSIFVSNAENAVRMIQMGKATPEQWQKMIEKNGGLKAGEDKWLGLSDWLKASDRKSITKQEILDFIDQNKIRIEETRYHAEDEELGEIDMKVPGFSDAYGMESMYDDVDIWVRDEEAARALYEKVEGKDASSLERWELEEYGRNLAMDIQSGSPSMIINGTRLGYTTEGLDRKREIALTVPTIEAWNEGDMIHFGDAGQGRAIAWVRFGDDTIDEGNDVQEADMSEQLKEYEQKRNSLLEEFASKYGFELSSFDPTRIMPMLSPEDAKRLQDVVRTKPIPQDRVISPKKRVLFIDEIQSKRHQEGREHGYRETYKELEKEADALEKRKQEMLEPLINSDKYKGHITDEGESADSDEIWEEYNRDRSKIDGYDEIENRLESLYMEIGKRKYNYEGIPAAPFEKNWHELAMKRMLRLAAEEGYDYVAWTKGEQQAERYSLGGTVNSIEVAPVNDGTREVTIESAGADIYLDVDEQGTIIGQQDNYGENLRGKKLYDVVGKEMAVKIMSATKEETISGDGLRIGGEGMKGFYDDILPRFVNKYAKKWGVKVEDINLPNLESNGITAHAIPVTEEMKESVMEGQLMFSVQAVEEQEDRQRLIGAVDNGGLEAVLGDEGAQEFYRDAYISIPESELRKIVEQGLAEGGNIYAQLRAYMHKLAQDGTENDPTGLLFKLFDDVRFMTANAALTDSDIRYIIWKGTSTTDPGDILAIAEARAMRNRWGVGEMPMEQQFQEATEIAAENTEERLDAAKRNLKEEKKQTYGPLEAINRAMAAQKTYDKETVDSIVKFAKEIMKNGGVSALTLREANRLLSLINNSTGKSPKFVTRYADQLMDMLLEHIVKEEAAKFDKLVNVKANKVSSSGVEVQGKLDIIGQAVIKAFRENMNSPVEDIRSRMEDATEKMDDKDDAIREEAMAAYSGLMLALQYKEKIADNEEEYKDLKREFNEVSAKLPQLIGRKAYDEFIASSKEALRKNLMERVDMYRELSRKLTEMIGSSAERAAEFRKAEQARIEDIHHDANRDMQGVSTREHRRDTAWQRFLNSDFVRFFLKSLATGDQMFRMLGRKSVDGQGFLFNRYIKNGFIPASERAARGMFDAYETLDAKVSEVFDEPGMKWSDLYRIERKLPGMTVSFLDGGEMIDHELTQGNMLYIYMANKMNDGKMKLRKMGISEEDVQAIKKNLDPRFVELADWMQDEFYVNLRNKYNEVHERMFGAPMAAIEDYVPLKILSNARFEDVDLGSDQSQAELSSTITGSIIKRRRNSLALDILHTDAFSLAIEHVEKMEDWAAFAELRRDMNTLLSYKHFRNQVQNMNTVYGSGKTLWDNFKDVCKVTIGKYQPKVKAGDIDTMALNVAKGVTAAKIAFRVNTAIKQLLSFPAYLSDARIDYLMKSLATPGKSWKWCMENLPLFEKRWKSRIAGDTRLLDTDSDWKIWRDNVVKTASRLGMTPNAFVDATTVAIGAKAMYDTKKAQYLKDGYSEEKADDMAKKDAEILYNQTQQSSETAFVSPVQLDRTVMAVTLTTYRNSSMAYQRQLHDAIRTTARMMKPGYRDRSIAFMKNQNMNNGLSEEEAQRAAERQYNRQWLRNLARVAVFGYGLQFLWKIGNDMWYLLFGDDDDEKQKILEEAALAELAAPLEGLVAGNVISDAWGSKAKEIKEGEKGIKQNTRLDKYGLAQLPLVSDMKSILNELSYDKPRAINDIINLVAQSVVGVNPQTLSDAVVAFIDYTNGDVFEARELAYFLMRVAQLPQSTIEKFLIDEIDMGDPEKRKEDTDRIAKRYAVYKVMKNAPLTQGMYDEGTMQKRLKAAEKSFRDKVSSRIKVKENAGEEAPETAEDIYKRVEKESKAFQADINRAKKNNDTLTMNNLMAQPEYQQYLIWKKHQKGINKLNNSIKKTDDDALRQEWEAQLKDSIQTVINELNATE